MEKYKINLIYGEGDINKIFIKVLLKEVKKIYEGQYID